MFRRRHLITVHDTLSIAGWIFADLLLGLSMLFLVFNTSGTLAGKTPTPTATPGLTALPATLIPTLTALPLFKPTPTPTLTSVPLATPTPAIVPLDLTPLTFTVSLADSQAFLRQEPAAIESFLQQLERNFPQTYRSRRAGLIITLGYQTSNNIPVGRQTAILANSLIIKQYPVVFSYAGVVRKEYWWDPDENHPVGTIQFEIYFFED